MYNVCWIVSIIAFLVCIYIHVHVHVHTYNVCIMYVRAVEHSHALVVIHIMQITTLLKYHH